MNTDLIKPLAVRACVLRRTAQRCQDMVAPTVAGQIENTAVELDEVVEYVRSYPTRTVHVAGYVMRHYKAAVRHLRDLRDHPTPIDLVYVSIPDAAIALHMAGVIEQAEMGMLTLTRFGRDVVAAIDRIEDASK